MAPADDDHTLYVAFLKREPTATAVKAVQSLCNEVDDFLVRGREVYCLRRTRRLESTLTGPRFEKALQQSSTTRNITTVRKLAQQL
jgi:uncharacterized protein (DUF1697 family)